MMLNPSEISELIKEKIENFEGGAAIKNVGKIVSLADGIVRIHGLETVKYGEISDPIFIQTNLMTSWPVFRIKTPGT